ncbi:hypothetical protein HYH03_007907 [Edaphochlamys debaryana]|uniref:Transmembrane 9 superfamily member n=1 Tax=Edaphochlamys debaryana TaxID=47281 RepID=A0A835Y1A8_9CHLO|nr:hypothetical protein HYH03_007907 [Edaphochlamys debaryana]|eukprot:KAG2493980.1 hypothetical protein HYH03_007907 [Edaphochlamys debaryana]
MARALLLAVMALTLGGSATAEEELPSKHRYDTGDDVVLFASKIGPFENPTETYPYYDLPFCQPPEGTRGKAESLGEALGSDRLVSTPYVIKYGVNVRHAILCKKSLDAAAVKGFRDAVMQGYYWQMYMDELPLWGFVGEVAKGANAGAGASASSERYFLFTYLSFDVFHDGQGHIVKVTVSSGPIRGGGYAAGTEDSSEYSEYSGAGTEYGGEGNGTAPLVPVDITVAGDIKDVEFKYSVRWVRSDFDSYDSRMDRYLAVALLPHHLERHRLAVT